jgi:hypothetical protein
LKLTAARRACTGAARLAAWRRRAYRAAVPRTAIDTLLRLLNAAYRDDPFHALRKNILSVRPEEWDVRPAEWSAEEFGDWPELSICDLALHAGAKYMYADRAFGDATLEWEDIKPPPSRAMDDVVAWLDAAHQLMVDGLTALEDDARLDDERQAPWRTPMRRAQLIAIITNHDLYHSGEINRQRALLRGADGWQRDG